MRPASSGDGAPIPPDFCLMVPVTTPTPPPPAWGVPQGRLKTGYPKITAIAQDLTIMQWGPAPPPCRLSPRRNIMPTKLQHLGLGWFLPGCLQGRGQPRDSSGAGTRLHGAGVTHK